MYSIGECAARCGISSDTLRYYEKEKLLRPARSAAGRRMYSEADLAWIEFVQRLRATDMPIREIARYSELREAGDSTMAERLAMLRTHEKKLEEEIQRKRQHLDVLMKKIAWYEKHLPENM